MNLVTFFSEDNVVSVEIKIIMLYIFSNIKVTKIERYALGDTRFKLFQNVETSFA